jgi:hypothetical protein
MRECLLGTSTQTGENNSHWEETSEKAGKSLAVLLIVVGLLGK